MKKTVKSMVDEATAAITTYSIEEARDLHGREDVHPHAGTRRWAPDRAIAMPCAA